MDRLTQLEQLIREYLKSKDGTDTPFALPAESGPPVEVDIRTIADRCNSEGMEMVCQIDRNGSGLKYVVREATPAKGKVWNKIKGAAKTVFKNVVVPAVLASAAGAAKGVPDSNRDEENLEVSVTL